LGIALDGAALDRDLRTLAETVVVTHKQILTAVRGAAHENDT
jgi:hypothetical protein